MKIQSNHQYLNEINKTPLATKYPQLVPIVLTYIILHRRTEHLIFDPYLWFSWKNTKEGYAYWANIAKSL